MDDPPITDAVGPEDAFAVLSDPIRIGILRELWTAGDGPTSFSDLREAVGVEDSGQFNYHLGKLTDRFVRKTEDGYELRAAGIRVVGAVLGGAYTMEGSTETIALDEPCPSCGGDWHFSYEDEFARLDCEHCPIIVQYPIPPATFVDATPEEMPERTERYIRALLEQLRNGICPYCEGRIHPRATVQEPPESSAAQSGVPLVEYDCGRCQGNLVTDLASPLLTHPAVSAFYFERDIDVREPSLWRFTEFGEDRTVVEDTDPLRFSVTFEAEGDVLTVTVDGSLEVLEVEEP